jgi:hypothetical protein
MFCEVSGFCHGVTETSILLGCYAMYVGTCCKQLLRPRHVISASHLTIYLKLAVDSNNEQVLCSVLALCTQVCLGMHSILLHIQVAIPVSKHSLQWQKGYKAHCYVRYVKNNEYVAGCIF